MAGLHSMFVHRFPCTVQDIAGKNLHVDRKTVHILTPEEDCVVASITELTNIDFRELRGQFESVAKIFKVAISI